MPSGKTARSGGLSHVLVKVSTHIFLFTDTYMYIIYKIKLVHNGRSIICFPFSGMTKS